MSTIAEKIAVMQAFDRGADIERRYKGCAWQRETGPLWDWVASEYRIKPRSVWIGIYPNGARGTLFYDTREECESSVACSQGTAFPTEFR